MNLKDRINSGSQIQEHTEAPTEPITNSGNTTLNSNQQLMDLIQKQAETITYQKNQIQTLSSEKSDLISAIADLRAELSSVQKINLSLTKKNDDLRNSAGLMSRKEQDKLEKELSTTQALLSEANKMVNMSNVEAVRSAQAAKEAADQKAVKDIADNKKLADNKISEAIKAKNAVIRKADEKIKAAGRNRQIAQGSLLITLLCCLIVHPAFVSDIWDFVYVPAMWVWNSLDGPVSAILTLAFLAGIGYGIFELWRYYRKRWCSLSQRVLLASLAIVIIFGDCIRR